MSGIAVIIPTFNERENIGSLMEVILTLVPTAHIYVVDDNSPDKTAKVVSDFAEKDKRVTLILREGKGGRGSACIAGFKKALETPVNQIVEMDADFSHDPKELPRILEASEKFDVLIGSRYLKESRILNWSLRRRIFSRMANFYARRMLGIPLHDYTNGYRCYKRKALESVEFDKVFSRGYVVLSEMAYQLFRKGFVFGEVPTVFVNRRRGASNVNLKEIFEAFTSVFRIRRHYQD